MRAIIIGAGRGSRLMPTTADTPKCFAEIGGRRILDWTLEALRKGGVDEICFIGGYRIDCVQRDYPEFEFRHNSEWQNNNIMASLFYAEDLMNEPFICSYSDILYRPAVVESLMKSEEDMTAGVDTGWVARYDGRTEHPTSDAEKVTAKDGVITRFHREIEDEDAYGEFIGVAKFSEAGAARLLAHYHRCRDEYAGRPFREAEVFEKAYLLHLLQDMVEAGERIAHVDTPGEYIEVDTQQDFEYAQKNWS
ncbi:MAG: NTP transferase domain-containing protein [Myxococcota bacterium]